VIAALRFRYWPGEGFETIVIATDSQYIVEGSTRWSRTWVLNDWKTSIKNEGGRASVKNRDLWEALLGECEKAHSNGLAIKFWKIPREWNQIADEKAKNAAAAAEAPVLWSECFGIAI
jgi:ribonuclease HI